MSEQVSATLDFLGKLANFLILFGGLGVVLRKPLKAMLAKRAADIGETLRASESGRAAAEAAAADSRARISRLEDDIGRLKSEAEEAARLEAGRIGQTAAEEAERLKRITRQEVEEQVRVAVRELRAYAAVRASALARERIRKRLTPDLQADLIDKSIDSLSHLHEKPAHR